MNTWPAPKGNPCSFFLDVDLVFFFCFFFKDFFWGGLCFHVLKVQVWKDQHLVHVNMV